MAVITGWLTEQTKGGLTTNPNLSHELWDYEYVAQFNPSPYANVSPSSLIGALVNNLPVEANGRAITGFRASSFFDQWYNTIHVSPQTLDLGNIVSVQTQNLYVWNAYFEPKTLGDIQGLDEGMQVSGQPDPPLEFRAQQERAWVLSVTPTGPANLDAEVLFIFGDVQVGAHVTGSRIVAWLPRPDWSDGILERLSWLTDMLQSESLVEQRRALRTAPRRQFEADFVVEGRERQALDVALYGWGARMWALPIWPDIQWLDSPIALGAEFIPCQTVNLDFRVGGLLILRDESALNFEAAEVAAIDTAGLSVSRPLQQAWPAGTRLYPARTAQLEEQPELTRKTDRLSQLSAKFLVMEACDWPEYAPTILYRGYPVYDARPDESEDLTHSLERNLLTLDSSLSTPLVTDTAGFPLPVIGYRWLELGRADRAWLRGLLYYWRGKQQAMWIPTHAEDMTLAANVTAGNLTLDIENIGYSRYARGKTGRKDIRIELWDGQSFHRRIVGATEISADIERLELDSSTGLDIAPDDVLRISYLALCRLNDDSAEIEHMTDSEGVASCSLVFRGVRDDDF